MRKRILALLLALVLSASILTLPASAAFTDVSGDTAASVEVLRLMGVLDGYGDGTFRPATQLNRAQFCKMVTYLTDGGDELGKYRAITIFPDVKPSHWASAYINLAARGAKVIAGFPDGSFHPERTVTAGQAVTILLRLLGYTDEEIGGVWPSSQMAMAESIHLTDGTGISGGNAALTRGQAAGLFVNFLRVDKKGGGTYYELGTETTLIAVDGGAGTMTTADGKTYKTVRGTTAPALVGMKGQAVLNDEGKALTFLPVSAGGMGLSSGAVIVYEDGSTAGLSALTGGSTNYHIYKNGSPATAADLKKNDVAIWNAATRSVQVCDTRVTVCYESCAPDPDAPATIEVLNGTQFSVLPTAAESLSKFEPGDQMTLLLTADGQVAAAVEPSSRNARSNAVGIVSADGDVQMFCGNTLIPLTATSEEDCFGKVVRISSGKRDSINLSVLRNEVSGDLKIAERKLGAKSLAEHVMVFEEGQLVGLAQMPQATLSGERILYARTNWKDQVDLIVLDPAEDMIYGRVFWDTDMVDGENGETKYIDRLGVEFGNDAADRVGPFKGAYPVKAGDFVAVKINAKGTGYASVSKLTELRNVSDSAWVGRTAVTHGGRSYAVSPDLVCYNSDSRSWVVLDLALAYGGTVNLYAQDGVVHVLEVSR